MTLTLRFGSFANWYVLEGGANWASIEGDASEWIAVANALRHRDSVRFKRLACTKTDKGWDLYAPRNACGSRDTVHLPEKDGAALADDIARCLAAPREDSYGDDDAGD